MVWSGRRITVELADDNTRCRRSVRSNCGCAQPNWVAPMDHGNNSRTQRPWDLPCSRMVTLERIDLPKDQEVAVRRTSRIRCGRRRDTPLRIAGRSGGQEARRRLPRFSFLTKTKVMDAFLNDATTNSSRPANGGGTIPALSVGGCFLLLCLDFFTLSRLLAECRSLRSTHSRGRRRRRALLRGPSRRTC